MSLRLNKDKIFFLNTHQKYEGSTNIISFMEKDFTLLIDVKINKEGINKDYPTFIISRNGKHSGLSAILTENNEIVITFSYWLYDDEQKDVIREGNYTLPKQLEDNVNRYVITCDNESKNFKMYVNGVDVFTIDYCGLSKQSYLESFLWFGCGTMIGKGDNYKSIGDFEYSSFMALDIVVNQIEITDIMSKHNESYINLDKYPGLPTLKKETPLLNNIKLFYDFTTHNPYKMWDLTGNGNHAQLYIENNIYF